MVSLHLRRGLGITLSLVVAFTLLACQAQPNAPIAPTKAVSPQPTAASPSAAASTAVPAAPPTALAPAATPAAAAPSEVLKLGIMVPLSGATARNGFNSERFIRLGMDELNAKGGVKVGGKAYRFEAVTVDDKSTSDGGREAANRLVLAEKVKFVLGAISTPLAGAQAVTEPNKVLVLADTAVDRSLGPSFPLTLQFLSHLIMRQGAVYDWLVKERTNAKRIAIVFYDDPTGRAAADQADARAKERNLTVAAKEFYPIGTKDFSALVTRVLREKPDALDVGGLGGRPAEQLGLMKALAEQGFKGPVISTSVDVGATREGGDTMEGITTAQMIDYKSSTLTEGDKAAIQRYLQVHPEPDLEPIVIPIYNAPLLLAQAMEKAGTVDDTEKIASTLRAGEWDTIWSKQFGKARFAGAKTFGLPSILEQPVYLSRVDRGKLVTAAALKGALP